MGGTATPRDARDLLISAVLCDDPVLYIDDRWLYALEEDLPPVCEIELRGEGSRVMRPGRDVTLVGCGYTTQVCAQAAQELERQGVSAEVVDLRVLNPLDSQPVVESVTRTGRLCVVDGGWRNCGMAGEVIARVTETLDPTAFKASPARLTLPDAPAPTSRALEAGYYIRTDHVVEAALQLTAPAGQLIK